MSEKTWTPPKGWIRIDLVSHVIPSDAVLVNGLDGYKYWNLSNPNQSITSASIKAVTHPPHYNKHPSGVECLAIVRHMNFNRGNAMKYIWRADLKGEGKEAVIENLEKAAFYIQDEITRVRAEK